MNKRLVISFAALALAANAFAVETKFWEQDEKADFEKGSLKGLSLRSDGQLTLGPAVSEIFDASTPYLWALARDSKGNLYAGGGGSDGSNVRLTRIDTSGKATVFAELPGIAIQAIAIDHDDHVYAATSPDGKVYKIASAGKPEVFVELKAKYIWALAFRGSDLFVATGSPGEILRVTPDKKSAVFFKTDETHARALAIDAKGNLIVGTDPGGLVIRVSPAGEGFVLYQTPKSEVSSVAVAPNGDIYAAALGPKVAGSPAAPPLVPVIPIPNPAAPAANAATSAARPAPSFPAASHITPALSGGSEVFWIEPDGSTRRVWSDTQALVYAIAFDANGRPLLGTGNGGILYRVDSPVLNTRLADLAPTQITAFCAGPDGSVYAATGNIGKVFHIGPGLAAEGTFESDVFDAGWFSRWGRLTLKPEKASVSVATRSGNLDRPRENWSPWQDVRETVASPAARFLQYKLTFHGNPTPALSSVSIAYLQKNVAPEIPEMEVTPPNYRFPAPVAISPVPSSPQSISLPSLGGRGRSGGSASIEMGTSSSMSYAKGYIGVRWNANDDNGDSLIYKLEIRGVHETAWRPLRDKIREKYYSWDSATFADGEYQVRVTASDQPSNPQGLSASLVSDPFTIDNTPPTITDAAASATIRWKAHDALNIISKAEYSIDGGEWLVAEPVTGLSDSHDEEYSISPGKLAPGEHVVAIRVTDDYDNQAVTQLTLH